ncbi:hypothetical protein ACX0GZ_06690 [Sphingomonas aestuarii]
MAERIDQLAVAIARKLFVRSSPHRTSTIRDGTQRLYATAQDVTLIHDPSDKGRGRCAFTVDPLPVS